MLRKCVFQFGVSHAPKEPDTKKHVITTILKTSALDKRGKQSIIALRDSHGG
jgi:hypothetical protein